MEHVTLGEEFVHPCAAIVLRHDGFDKVASGCFTDLRLLLRSANVLAIGAVIGHGAIPVIFWIKF